MAKKTKPAAAKSAAEKPAKTKQAANTMQAAVKSDKASAKPAKPTVKPAKAAQGLPSPRAAKKLAAPAAALPLGTAPPTSPPSLSDRYASFEDARNATIDTLLASIEAAEARLLEVKRSSTFEQLEPLANGAG